MDFVYKQVLNDGALASDPTVADGPYGGPMLISMHLHIFDIIIFYIPDSSECVRSMLAEKRKTYISSHCIYWHRRWIEWRSDCLWSIALDAVLCRVSVPSSLLCFFFHMAIRKAGPSASVKCSNSDGSSVILTRRGKNWIQRPTTNHDFCHLAPRCSVIHPQLFGNAACWIATVFKNKWEQHDITCTYLFI